MIFPPPRLWGLLRACFPLCVRCVIKLKQREREQMV